MTGLDLSQVKRLYVRPALIALGLDDPARLNLITGIGLVESGYIWLIQRGGGPAKGFWQMEPATHDDCWENFLRYPRQSRLASGLHTLLGGLDPTPDRLITHPVYAAAMAAVKIRRAPEALPDADDAAGMSRYHKRWYNTPLGAASADRNVSAFQAAIRA